MSFDPAEYADSTDVRLRRIEQALAGPAAPFDADVYRAETDRLLQEIEDALGDNTVVFDFAKYATTTDVRLRKILQRLSEVRAGGLTPTVPFSQPVDLTAGFYDDFGYADTASLDASGWNDTAEGAGLGPGGTPLFRVLASDEVGDPISVDLGPGFALALSADGTSNCLLPLAFDRTPALAVRVDLTLASYPDGVASPELYPLSCFVYDGDSECGAELLVKPDTTSPMIDAYGVSGDNPSAELTDLLVGGGSAVLFAWATRNTDGTVRVVGYAGPDAATQTVIGDLTTSGTIAADFNRIYFQPNVQRHGGEQGGTTGGVKLRVIAAANAAAGAAALGVTLPA
jgi:hypothetical protein